MTDAPEPPVGEKSNNPDSEWLLHQARAAMSMGITEVEDMREMLNNADVEISRARMSEVAQHLSEIFERQQEIWRGQADILAQMVDGPTRVAQEHLEAQTQMLQRLAKLAPTADITELAQLMIAYSHLPAPYAQSFYWPLGDNQRDGDDQPTDEPDDR